MVGVADAAGMNPTSPVAVIILALASCSAPQVSSVAPSAPKPVRGPVTVSPAPQASEPTGLTDEQTAKNRARPYVEGLAALELFRTSNDCANQHSREVLDLIEKLRSDVSMFNTVRSFPQYEREARDRHTALGFAFADEALSRDCLDAADGVYRDIFTFYSGASYAGIRDRAKLGIEDVRARRVAAASASK